MVKVTIVIKHDGDEYLPILKQGVHIWNKWRRENPRATLINFSRVDLSGFDLHEANLTGINFNQANLSKTDLRNTELGLSTFNFTDFSKSNLSKVSFQNSNVAFSHFSQANLQEANFKGAILTGSNFYNANLYKADFTAADVESADFSFANLEEATFYSSKAWRIKLKNARLSGTDFVCADIREADFSYINFSNLYLNGAVLTSSKLYKANLENACLRNAYLGHTDLRYANLKNSILSEAKFYTTNASHANFSNASLSLARTSKADFSHAILTGSCLQNFHLDRETKFNFVKCDYFYKEEIYLSEERKYLFKHRCPHNPEKKFAQGEFTKLFQKTIETIDLVFSDGINWQAFLHSFQKLQIECNSEELAIQAIEKKSGGAFVIRVEVPSDANEAEIEKYLEDEYKLKLQFIKEKCKLQLGAKDEQIDLYRQHNTDLLEIIKREANRPINSNNSMSNINQYHSGNGDNVGRDKNINNIHESLGLTQIIEEIEAVLKKLEQTYNPNTTTGKMTIATKAIEHIEEDKNFTKRVLSALEKGGTAWLQSKLINPSASFLVEALKDWQKNKQ